MTFVVSGPCASVRLGGADVLVEHGMQIPDGVDKKTIEHLVDVGLVTEVKSSKSEPVDPMVRPEESAGVAAWRDHLVAKYGVDAADAKKLDKAAVIAKVAEVAGASETPAE